MNILITVISSQHIVIKTSFISGTQFSWDCFTDEPSLCQWLLTITLGAKTPMLSISKTLQCLCTFTASNRSAASGPNSNVKSSLWHSPHFMLLVMIAVWWRSSATDWVWTIWYCFPLCNYVYKLRLNDDKAVYVLLNGMHTCLVLFVYNLVLLWAIVLSLE